MILWALVVACVSAQSVQMVAPKNGSVQMAEPAMMAQPVQPLDGVPIAPPANVLIRDREHNALMDLLDAISALRSKKKKAKKKLLKNSADCPAAVCTRFAANETCAGAYLTCAAGGVKRIELRDAQLGGSLSTSLGALTSLTSLVLESLGLVGEVPELVLPQLATLSLRNNSLTGSLSLKLGNLTDCQLHDNCLDEETCSSPCTCAQRQCDVVGPFTTIAPVTAVVVLPTTTVTIPKTTTTMTTAATTAAAATTSAAAAPIDMPGRMGATNDVAVIAGAVGGAVGALLLCLLIAGAAVAHGRARRAKSADLQYGTMPNLATPTMEMSGMTATATQELGYAVIPNLDTGSATPYDSASAGVNNEQLTNSSGSKTLFSPLNA